MKDFKNPVDTELWILSDKLSRIERKIDNLKKCLYFVGGLVVTIIIDVIIMYIN